MNTRFEEQFLDYLEGRLPDTELRAFEEALQSDAGLRAALADYKAIMGVESAIAQTSASPHSSFSVKVMQSIEAGDSLAPSGIFTRFFMFMQQHRRMLAGSLATFATLIIVVRLSFDTSMRSAALRGVPRSDLVELESSRMKEAGASSEALQSGVSRGPVVPQAASLADASKKDEGSYPGNQKFESQPIIAKEKASSSSSAARAVDSKSISSLSDNSLASSEQDLIRIEPEKAVQERDRNSAVLGKAIDRLQETASHSTAGAPMVGNRGAAVRFDDRRIAAASLGSSTGMPGWIQQEPSNESYNTAVEGGRVLVKTEPVSTFSIDVDTASYSNVRRMVRSGQLPPADAVRIEEMINYFDYQYPVQYERPFTLSYEMAPSPLDQSRYLLKLGIKARDVEPNAKGWNLVFLVDVSGSMSDNNKLPLLKRALPVLVDRMRPEDRLAIVTYAGNAGVALESTSGNEKYRILNAIDNLSSGGSTNGAGGIRLAYDIARQHRIEGGVNRVILATDGDFNVGVTSQQDLIRMIEQERRSGITLTTIGVGEGNLKDGTLEQLADKGNGNYFYLDSFNEARKVLQTDLVGNMEVVAKDVKLQIEFNPEQVVEYRLMGYDNRRLENRDFNNDAIDAGEIGSGHTVTAMYELVLKNSEAAKQLEEELRYQKAAAERESKSSEAHNGELAFLKIRFKRPDANNSELIQYPILASDIRRDAQQTSSDFRFAAAVAYFGHLLKQSQYPGNYSMQDVIQLAQGAKGSDAKGYRQEFVELAKDAAVLLQRSQPQVRPLAEDRRRYP